MCLRVIQIERLGFSRRIDILRSDHTKRCGPVSIERVSQRIVSTSVLNDDECNIYYHPSWQKPVESTSFLVQQ